MTQETLRETGRPLLGHRRPDVGVIARSDVDHFPLFETTERQGQVFEDGNSLKRPRGVLLLSPPGGGKSQFCKALGKEVGRPVLVLDMGSLLGSLVGQSEERTR